MPKGCLLWFCAEWQRARRVLVADQDTLREIRDSLSNKGVLNPRSVWVQTQGLQGWLCDVTEAIEAGFLDDGNGRSFSKNAGPATDLRVAGIPEPSSPKSPGSPSSSSSSRTPWEKPAGHFASASRTEVPDVAGVRGMSPLQLAARSPSPVLAARAESPSRGRSRAQSPSRAHSPPSRPASRNLMKGSLSARQTPGLAGIGGSCMGPLPSADSVPLVVGALLLQTQRFCKAAPGAGTAASGRMPPGGPGWRSAVRSPSPPRSATPLPRNRAMTPSDDLDAFGPAVPFRRLTSGGAAAAEKLVAAMTVRPVLFWNPAHPLAGLPDRLTKHDFIDEVRRRLRVSALFAGTPAAQLEAVLSVEEAEVLYDALLVLQAPDGLDSMLNTGRRLDVVAEQVFALHKLRQAVERSAPSLKAFFKARDVNGNDVLEANEIRQLLRSLNTASERQSGARSGLLSMQGVDVARMTDIFLSILDVDNSDCIELWEFRRQLALVAPPGVSMIDLAAHFELKYGYCTTGTTEPMDCRQWYNRLSEKEGLDTPLEDALRCFHVWRGQPITLQPNNMQAAMRRMPLEVAWGLDDDAVDRFYCGLGVRALQLARTKRRDACMMEEGTIEDVADILPEHFPTKADLKNRFEHLWQRCVPAEGAWEKGGGAVGEQMRDACLRRYLARVRAVCSQRDEPTPAAGRTPWVRVGPRSLFPNIADVLAVTSTKLYAGQPLIVRYRLMGAQNFVHQTHVVLQDGHAPCAWPVPVALLGDTPFVGLVPRGLRWTNAGGGGFYLGKEAFSHVDMGLRADLPREATTGNPHMYGCVELSAPNLVRGSGLAAHNASHTSSPGVAPSGEFELRLFCARNKKIIGCIGDPIFVTVDQRHFPPPLETLQVRLDGRRAILRWTPLNLGPYAPDAHVMEVQLHMRSSKAEKYLRLDPDVTEFEMHELTRDTEYEFRVRLRGMSGPGREASVTCRTNSPCSEPKNFSRVKPGTNTMEVSWDPPDSLGNEVTKDRMQLNPEAIVRYEATLQVDDPDRGASMQLDSDPADEAAGSKESTGRACTWTPDTLQKGQGKQLIAKLAGLRPDVRYVLSGLCAVNSMGAGNAAPRLIFHTLPLTPKVRDVRVRNETVVVQIRLPGTGQVEFEATVALQSKPDDTKKFTVGTPTKKTDSENGAWEVSLPFGQMALAEAPTAAHLVKLRAKNEGGWSEWSDAFETISISRQQGAEAAQARLLQAIKTREIEELARVLSDARDIEFSDMRPMEQARQLLEVLAAARDELRGAERARDPDRLRTALARARDVGLPDLDRTQALLVRLTEVKEQLDSARGIVALRAALKAGHEEGLPAEILQGAVNRLGTREAAQINLIQAMEAARVPGLAKALEAVSGMHLPEEEEARRLLKALEIAELLLRAALETRLLTDLEAALESAAECGLREDELLAEVRSLQGQMEGERERARVELQRAMEERFPDALRVAISGAIATQVSDAEVQEGEARLKDLEGLLAAVAKAKGAEERAAALSAASEGQVPTSLVEKAQRQLERLSAVLRSRHEGDVPGLRKALKQASLVGVKEVELAESASILVRWTDLLRTVDDTASLALTANLKSAITRALDAGIHSALLYEAQQTLESLQHRDNASAQLAKAAEECHIGDLKAALRQACVCEVHNRPLFNRANARLRRLQKLNLELHQAVVARDLRRIHFAVQAAGQEPGLRDEELEGPRRLLAAVRQAERDTILHRFEQAKEGCDFRALDALATRGRIVAEWGVAIDEEVFRIAHELARNFQGDEQREMEAEIHQARFLGQNPSQLALVEESTSPLKIAPEHDIVHLPFEVTRGEVRMEFRPYGKELAVLPRDIVQCRISIVAGEVEDAGDGADASDKADLKGAQAKCDELLRRIEELLENEDEIRRLGDVTVRHDGAHHRVDLEIAIYLRQEELTGPILVKALLAHGAIDGEVADKRGRAVLAELLADASCSDDSSVKSFAEEGDEDEDEGETGTPKDRHQSQESASPVGFHSECDAVPKPVIGLQTLFRSATQGRPLRTSVMKAALQIHSRASVRTAQKTLSRLVPDFVNQRLGASCLQKVLTRQLRRVTVEVTYECPMGLGDSLDTACLFFDDEGISEIVMCGGKSVVHAGDDERYKANAREGEFAGAVSPVAPTDHGKDSSFTATRAGRRLFQVCLDILPDRVRDFFIVHSPHTARDLAKFQNIHVRVWDTQGGVELATHALGNGGRSESLVSCSVNLLRDGLWHVHGMSLQSRGSTGDLRPVLEKLQELGFPRNVGMRSHVPAILEAICKHLELLRPVKPIKTSIGDNNLLQVEFVYELLGSEANPGDSAEVDERMADRTVPNAIVAAIQTSGDERFTVEDISLLRGGSQAFTRLRADFMWGFPAPEDVREAGEERECNFLDPAIIMFNGASLMEVVDYRGPHGVRLVHNGVYDEAGVWFGQASSGDASDGAVWNVANMFDDYLKTGQHSMEINLPKLPPTVTDIFFVISTPMFHDIGVYKDIKVVFRDANNLGHEVISVSMPALGAQQEAAVLCRISRRDGNYWRIGAFRSSTPGSSPDYRPLLATLRNIQERTQGRATVPSLVDRSSRLKTVANNNIFTTLGNRRPSAAGAAAAGDGKRSVVFAERVAYVDPSRRH